MKQLLTLFCALFTWLMPLYAQVTVTNSIFPKAGTTIRTATASNPDAVTITAPGSNKTWNFGNLIPEEVSTTTYNAASSGKFKAFFPQANLMEGDSAETYFRTTASIFELHGIASGAGTDAFPFPLGSDTVIIKPTNPYLVAQVPITYQATQNANASFLIGFKADTSLTNTIPGLDSVRLNITQRRNDEVDSWGKLTTPEGNYDALRIKSTQTNILKFELKISIFGIGSWIDASALGFPSETTTTLSYQFVANNVPGTVLTATLDSAQQVVEDVEFYYTGTVSADAPLVTLDKVSVYPNPASDRLQLQFETLSQGNVQMVLFQLNGQRVSRTVHAVQPGTNLLQIPVQHLKNGLYPYALMDDNGLIIHKGSVVIFH